MMTDDDEIESPTDAHLNLIEKCSEFQIFVLKMEEERTQFADLCYEYWSDEFEIYRNIKFVYGVIETSFPEVFVTQRTNIVINLREMNDIYRKYQYIPLVDIGDEELREKLRFARENRHIVVAHRKK